MRESFSIFVPILIALLRFVNILQALRVYYGSQPTWICGIKVYSDEYHQNLTFTWISQHD